MRTNRVSLWHDKWLCPVSKEQSTIVIEKIAKFDVMVTQRVLGMNNINDFKELSNSSFGTVAIETEVCAKASIAWWSITPVVQCILISCFDSPFLYLGWSLAVSVACVSTNEVPMRHLTCQLGATEELGAHVRIHFCHCSNDGTDNRDCFESDDKVEDTRKWRVCARLSSPRLTTFT